jgi:hypothetical protein
VKRIEDACAAYGLVLTPASDPPELPKDKHCPGGGSWVVRRLTLSSDGQERGSTTDRSGMRAAFSGPARGPRSHWPPHPLGPGCLNSARTSATRSTCQHLLFRGELGPGLVLRLVRRVARVFQDCLSINPKRPRYGKGRGAVSQALCDFRP